jgi:hypothetical protein
MILQGAVFYSLPEAADAGEELCHLDAHLKILVGVYPEDQSWKDQSPIFDIGKLMFTIWLPQIWLKKTKNLNPRPIRTAPESVARVLKTREANLRFQQGRGL